MDCKVRGPASLLAWLRSFMPWVIILLFLAGIAFTFFEISYNAGIPPKQRQIQALPEAIPLQPVPERDEDGGKR